MPIADSAQIILSNGARRSRTTRQLAASSGAHNTAFPNDRRREQRMALQKATNITWHAGNVTREDRTALFGHRGCTVWMTGLSACGKSTIAVAIEKRLLETGVASYVLDGDNIRHGMNKNLGFSAEDRAENIRRIGEVAKLFADAGVVVIASFISPYRVDRDNVRKLHEDAKLEFIECHVNTPLEVCEERDPKGLYKKARRQEIRNFTGIESPYEAPEHPEIRLDTTSLSAEQSVDRLLAYLQDRGTVTPPKR